MEGPADTHDDGGPDGLTRAQAIGHDLFLTLVTGILLFAAVSKTWPAGHDLHPTALHWVTWGLLAGVPLGFLAHALLMAWRQD